MCQNTNFASNFSEFFIVVISVVLFIILAVSSHYNAKIKEKMLLLTVFIIGLMAVFLYIYIVFGDCTEDSDSGIGLEQYRLACNSLCQRYIDSDYIPAEALHYCEKYYEIDLNENGKIHTEAGKVSAYGVCEKRVYCFNIIKCSWGADASRHLTAEKCKEIMCDYYTNQTGGDKEAAARLIEEKMQFGSCDLNDEAVAGHTDWWIDNFQDVDCSEE